jgi:tRNA pseudouridine38-40 synthase
MRNIALIVSYDGTSYHGWQCQPNQVTVQESITRATERILDHPVKIYAGGRTDSGVHAMGQVINFFTPKEIALRNLLRGLNALLPGDIRVRDAWEAPPDFHSRYSARSKTYVYMILGTPHNSPFLGRYVWHIPFALNLRAMAETTPLIRGPHDFSAFKKKDEVYRSTIREVLRAGVKKRGDLVYILIQATGFLRYMVRNIVGTLVLVGEGKLDKNGFRDIMESGMRENAGPTAPPRGLFLWKIQY